MRTLTLTVGLTFACLSPLAAQEVDPAPPGISVSQVENYFISSLRTDKRAELELAKLAAQRATSSEVKAFAQQIIQNEPAFLAKLERLPARPAVSTVVRTEVRTEPATAGVVVAPAARDTSGVTVFNRPTTNRVGAPPGTDGSEANKVTSSDRDGRAGGGGNNQSTAGDATPPNRTRAEVRVRTTGPVVSPPVVAPAVPATRVETSRAEVTTAATNVELDKWKQVNDEMSKRYWALVRTELNQMQGPEFDARYMGMQVATDTKAIATLEVMRRHAAGDLQRLVGEGLEATQEQLRQAKTVTKRLANSAAE